MLSKKNAVLSEFQIQKWILGCFEEAHLAIIDPPIVAINAHSADPHFETSNNGAKLQKGDFLLIDLWGKEKGQGAVFGDLTRVCVLAKEPTKKQMEVFSIVRKAQKAGIDRIKQCFQEKKPILGFEVDDVVRGVIREAGFEKYFIHRTGHSIGSEHLHGSGTHLDNLEMHETRPLVPGSCFSVEPGIYLPGEFGVRLESDVYIHLDGKVEVTGGEQDQIECLLQA
ncbi:MAG: M24 family metallopeptidase [Chlamydiae bacterium]|nr:M24 family metallopeptidase [Chlamydiota bacterium]